MNVNILRKIRGFISNVSFPLVGNPSPERFRRGRSEKLRFHAHVFFDNRGVSLTELLIVVAIFGILAVALGFSYQGWMGAYKSESQIKRLFVDLMNARTQAMQRNTDFSMTIAPDQYMLYQGVTPVWTYSRYRSGTPAPAGAPGDAIPDFHAQFDGPANYTFNSRGVSENNGTICLVSSADPDFDCIEISPTRIIMGKLTTPLTATPAGVCDEANCVAK